MKRHALVIGYGNTLRGDDGLGWEVAGQLAASTTDPSVDIISVQQLTPELADTIDQSDMVIFVDASSEGEPGTWRCAPVIPLSNSAATLGHHMDVAALMAYTQAVHHSRPAAWLVSVTAETFACHDNLSPKVEAALPAVVRCIREKIAAFNLSRGHASPFCIK